MTVKPPAHVAPYVEILGEEMAVAFLMEFGGGQLNIGENPRGTSRLAQFIGADLELEMARKASRLPRHVPTAKPWLAAVFKSKGLPVSEIARKLHSSETAVRRWLKSSPSTSSPDTRQMRLL